MKKIAKLSLAFTIVLASVLVESCKKEEVAVVTPVVPKLTYNANIKSIFVTNCTPCHLAGGFKVNKWDDYTTAKTNVALILDRIQRDVNAVGFMPQKGTTPVPAADIAKIKQWVTDGLLEN